MARILGLGGALRDGSYTLAALREALAIAEAAGVESRLIDLREFPLPLYHPNNQSPADYGPEAAERITRLIAALRWADGMIWASPAYHGAISGAVKNALDYAQFLSKDQPSFLYGKAIGLIGVGGGTIGAVNVVAQLTQIAQALRAQVVPLMVPITFAAKAFDGDRLTDAQIRRRLEGMVEEMVALATITAERRATLT